METRIVQTGLIDGPDTQQLKDAICRAIFKWEKETDEVVESPNQLSRYIAQHLLETFGEKKS